ncbi:MULTISPECIES: folylpolyglutamate synthase/dihydrofolate synthase family protein [Kosmotoga]|nr:MULTISPECIES: folylpolyglutamate synthase/dihydrofolate synthase family protein [Kosmotoga]MDI3523394.1 dihydrofolate synthase / folylpolyglutamate synthase [Kosmotoga sp.]MDK2952892.1 dihydrofolate synthase / folylpolyglutamate synthase [Kosmotoga sp.]OAA19921.1 folylpolyglutamate synthase [Kosmotoga sp. DU53]
MEYREALEYLYSSRPYGKIKYGLFRIEELMERLGNPQESYPTIHITGTNGKGSVATILKGVLEAHGLHVGMNISPHIVSFRERIQLDNRYITEEEVCETLKEILPAIETMDKKGPEYAPSFFEVVTAMAFHFFRKKKVDVAVIEVGLGGRYDATNIIKKPLVSVITTVSLDHKNILGKNEEKIAIEKAGIIKEGVPVVSGVTRPSIRYTIEEKAGEKNAPSYFLWKDFQVETKELKINENVYNYSGEETYPNLVLSLNGTHQARNLAVAMKTLEIAFNGLKKKIDNAKLRDSLKKTSWPGRFEVLTHKNRKIILDGAHNIDGAYALRNSLEIYFPGQKLDIIFGSLDDKDYESVISILAPISGKVVVTKVPSHRSINPERVREIWKVYHGNVEFITEPDRAFEKFFNSTQNTLLITGSLYLVSYLRNLIVEGVGDIDKRR